MAWRLNAPKYKFLPMREIKPMGWMLNQLKIQAEGLSGNLDKFWPDIKESRWIGGDKEGWERLPYWLDGFIPLAWVLDDEEMKERANKYINFILEKQDDDGWLCPVSKDERDKYDMWGLFLILKVLVVYFEATNDNRIQDVIRKALINLDKHIDKFTLFQWAHARWFEVLIPIWWLYERTEESWLIDLASKIRCQGFNWKAFFEEWVYQKPDEKHRWSQMSHLVNNMMAFKAGALIWRLSGKKEDLKAAKVMLKILTEYHGQTNFLFSGDECLSGRSPIQGTELCSVAEYMFSLENLISITGDASWSDILEKVAYNALPAALSPDMWTHQYDQQVNQAQCSTQKESVFFTNSGDANLFGLEPCYGCCTANLNQAWPKFLLSLFMKTDDGLVVAAYAPCKVETRIFDTNVTILLNTDYPFKDTLMFSIQTNKPVDFTLWLRIPDWTNQATVSVDGERIDQVGKIGYFPVQRKWKGETEVILKLPMHTILNERENNLFSITRGPLLYSLKIEEEWKQINQNIPGHEFPHCDYEVYPVSPWNYGLVIDRDKLESCVHYIEKSITDCPFSPEGAPVLAKLKGKRVNWIMKDGVVANQPELDCVGDEEEISMIPYGCTAIRMTEMPLV